jgi:alkylation response protein AidB-like acyl-CoA dehydrogenase
VTKLASMAKLKSGRFAREACDSCLQFWGGMGYTDEVSVSRYYYIEIECSVINGVLIECGAIQD